jgi:hypothetical protein
MTIPYYRRLGVHEQSEGFTDHEPWMNVAVVVDVGEDVADLAPLVVGVLEPVTAAGRDHVRVVDEA